MTGERGALEKDVHGVLVNLGVHAAHDASKGDRGLAVVGDDGHVRREGALDAIKVLELLAICGGADDDVAATVALGELAQVKGVQRLAGEEHDVVGHVDDVVDGAAAGGHDAAGQPLGRRADLDVADHAGGVALASSGSSMVTSTRSWASGPCSLLMEGSSMWVSSSYMAATSTAMPVMDRQSGRLGVISQSMTVSDMPR